VTDAITLDRLLDANEVAGVQGEGGRGSRQGRDEADGLA
jgi:hypothetical protein